MSFHIFFCYLKKETVNKINKINKFVKDYIAESLFFGVAVGEGDMDIYLLPHTIASATYKELFMEKMDEIF